MSQPTPKNRVLFVRRFTPVLLVFFGVFSMLLVNLRTPKLALAATNNTINFQARLEMANGSIAPDGNYNVEFKLYSASSGGSSLWTEDYLNSASQGIRTVNGYLTANLGGITAFPTTINWDQQLWITMNIGGTSVGSPTWDGEMNPRLALTAVPYAFRAGQLAQYSNGSGFTSTLSIQAPTGGNQTFQIQDQGAAGTYNLLTAPSGSDGYIKLQGSSPGTPQSGNFNINGTGIAGTLQAGTFDTATAVALNVGTSNATGVNIATNAVAHTIAIGNGAAVQGITVGSTNSTSSVLIQAGTGNLQLQTQGGTLGIGNNAITQTITIGNTTGGTAVTVQGGTGTINLGNSTTAHTTNLGSSTSSSQTNIQGGTGGLNIDTNFVNNTVQIGNTTSAAQQVINIGNNATASSKSTVTIGSLVGTSITTIQGGTGNINLVTNSASTGVVVNTQTSSTTAFSVQNASGSVFNVDTSANTITVGINTTTGGAFINNGSTLNAALALSNFATGGAIGTAATTVDTHTSFTINQTTSGQTLSLPNPTNTTAGRIIYLANIGTASFTVGSTIVSSGTNATFLWNGSTWSATAVSTGVTLIGALDGGTANINGATISGNTMYLQSASANFAGLVNTVAQTFAGNKTFSGQTTVGGGSNQTQLIVKSNSGQTASNPLVLLQNSSGSELARLSAPDTNDIFLGYTTGAGSTGIKNSAVGSFALSSGNTGNYNNAFGIYSLQSNTSGGANNAFGGSTLNANTTGTSNTAVGDSALSGNTTGSGNVAVGVNALQGNTTGSYNSALGDGANVSTGNLQNATALGTYSYVTQSNSLVLGCVAGTNSCSTTTSVGIGNTAPAALFSVGSSSQFQIDINGNVTTTGTVTIGSGSNTVIISAAGGIVASGTAQHTKTIMLTPEYAGAVLDVTSDPSCSGGSSHNGTMTSGYDSTNNMNYYDWTTTQTSTQCYDVVVQIPVPSDFSSWVTNPIHVYLKNDSSSTNYAIDVLNSSNSSDTTFCSSGYCTSPTSGFGSLSTTWGDMTSGASLSSTGYTAGGTITVKVRLRSTYVSSAANAYLGNIVLTYKSSF